MQNSPFLRYHGVTPPGSDGHFHFASDNTCGICPEAWRALQTANEGYQASYGNDVWTARAADLIRTVFATDCEIFFVFNGTSANSLSLSALCQSYHSVLCHELAHIERDECGAPEFFSNGTKILTIPGSLGKLQADAVLRTIRARSDLHFPKPRVVSLTQTTESGTVYTPEEIASITSVARAHGLAVHMDGARFANAAAALQASHGCTPADFTWKAGVDVLSFGGTKNGMNTTEAVVFFNRALSQDFEYRCKQPGQLASKMRFLSSQWVGMFEDGAWLRHAAHANGMARRLGEEICRVPGCSLALPTEANAVFFHLPPAAVPRLEAFGWHFYNFIGSSGYRLMCSWATREEDIQHFIRDLRSAVSA